MATITPAPSPLTNNGSSTPSTDAKGIANNFNSFLQLLTTQLKNQNPLDPLDTNQFTQQLVQFSSVEQQLKTNDTLTQLLSATRSSNITNGLGFVGMRVTADGKTTQLQGGSAQWTVNAPRAAQKATFTITDAKGNVMKTETMDLKSGDQSYSWDGKTSTGSKAPDGQYTLNIQAQDISGQPVKASMMLSGVVDTVDVGGDIPLLQIGSLTISADKVKTISRNN